MERSGVLQRMNPRHDFSGMETPLKSLRSFASLVWAATELYLNSGRDVSDHCRIIIIIIITTISKHLVEIIPRGK